MFLEFKYFNFAGQMISIIDYGLLQDRVFSLPCIVHIILLLNVSPFITPNSQHWTRFFLSCKNDSWCITPKSERSVYFSDENYSKKFSERIGEDSEKFRLEQTGTPFAKSQIKLSHLYKKNPVLMQRFWPQVRLVNAMTEKSWKPLQFLSENPQARRSDKTIAFRSSDFLKNSKNNSFAASTSDSKLARLNVSSSQIDITRSRIFRLSLNSGFRVKDPSGKIFQDRDSLAVRDSPRQFSTSNIDTSPQYDENSSDSVTLTTQGIDYFTTLETTSIKSLETESEIYESSSQPSPETSITGLTENPSTDLLETSPDLNSESESGDSSETSVMASDSESGVDISTDSLSSTPSETSPESNESETSISATEFSITSFYTSDTVSTTPMAFTGDGTGSPPLSDPSQTPDETQSTPLDGDASTQTPTKMSSSTTIDPFTCIRFSSCSEWARDFCTRANRLRTILLQIRFIRVQSPQQTKAVMLGIRGLNKIIGSLSQSQFSFKNHPTLVRMLRCESKFNNFGRRIAGFLWQRRYCCYGGISFECGSI